MRKHTHDSEIQFGPETLIVDRQDGLSSKPSLTLQTKTRPFGNDRFAPFFKSSVSFHDFKAIGDATRAYIDFAEWDNMLSASISGVMMIPYMTIVPFYGSKLSSGVGVNLPLTYQVGAPRIDAGAQMTAWLEPSNQDLPYLSCVGIFSGLYWDFGTHSISMQISYDWPIPLNGQTRSLGIIGSGLTWGVRQ